VTRSSPPGGAAPNGGAAAPGRAATQGPLLVASFNPGKACELCRLVEAAGYRTVTLRERGIDAPYEETGAAYEDNARGKALHYARLSGLPAIADDSGIEVEALGGAPGPQSARYGGGTLDDAGRCRLMLREMEGVPEERRAARYVAVAALARPPRAGAGVPTPGADPAAPAASSGEVRLFRGVVEGTIATELRGRGGFGYDPLFFYPAWGATFAEVPEEQKNRVSHRGVAFAALAAFLGSDEGRRFLGG
jgi:XTP/dITP diphosphohydrolase